MDFLQSGHFWTFAIQGVLAWSISTWFTLHHIETGRKGSLHDALVTVTILYAAAMVGLAWWKIGWPAALGLVVLCAIARFLVVVIVRFRA